MFYWDWTYILIIPGLLLGLWAQAKVKGAYAEWSRVGTRLGRSACDVVDDMLRRNGNNKVRIFQTQGELTDHYDPSNETLKLSQGVYASSSVAALGIAAHEAGHAMQKHEHYAPLKLRTAVVPVVNIGSSLSTPLFLAGIIFSWEPLVGIGILLFSLSVIFALITLPVEFNASSRAVKMLTEGGYITGEEERGVRKVLNASALTYVASAVTSLLSLLRLLLIARRYDRD
ncbi:MAG: zinc metallopeptidase [Clostridia bacterium]|nr:zinc metallopeptidase [Clostridia bacterium]